jgi:hypothetical protein
MSPADSRGDAGDWAAQRRRRRGRWLPLLLGVAAAHLLLLTWMQLALRAAPPRPGSPQPPLVLVSIQPATPLPAQAVPPQPAPPTTLRKARPAERATQPTATPPVLPTTEAPAAASVVIRPAQAAASVAPAAVLDTEASRRAIREAARQRSTGELGAAATGEAAPLSEQERMGQEIARGARGDCLKGEFAGSGMGLFSLPFWLMAELREKCRR